MYRFIACDAQTGDRACCTALWCLQDRAFAKQCCIFSNCAADQGIPCKICKHDTHICYRVCIDVVACQYINSFKCYSTYSDETGHSWEVRIVATESRSCKSSSKTRSTILWTRFTTGAEVREWPNWSSPKTDAWWFRSRCRTNEVLNAGPSIMLIPVCGVRLMLDGSEASIE